MRPLQVHKSVNRGSENMEQDCIRLINMGFYAYHGTSKAEREVGQRFYLDAEIYLNLEKAGQTDDVKDTIDYTMVYQMINDMTCQKGYHLIEALAQDIANTIIEKYPQIDKVHITVRKPQVPLICGILDHVEVSIVRNNKKR